MSDLQEQIEKVAVGAAKKQIQQMVQRLRCRTHGKSPTVRFPSGSSLHDLERGMTLENICCDAFKAEVEKAFK